MKRQHVDYRPEKARFGEYLAMFQGIKMPWLFIILIFVATVCSTFAALNISMFTGDMVDANGRVPAAQLAAFALSYLLVGLCTAGSAIFQGGQRTHQPGSAEKAVAEDHLYPAELL